MQSRDKQEVAKFVVRPTDAGKFDVFESGLEKPIAEFDDVDTAEKYALQVAETKSAWTVDTYDRLGSLIGAYNSEDDSMPKPGLG